MRSVPSWTRSGPTLWVGAAVIGLALGVIAFLVAPLLTDLAGKPSGGSTTTAPTTATRAPSGTSTAGEEAPPFTRSALLQPDELKGFGWGKADQTAIYDSVGSDLPLLCAAPATIEDDAVESYSAEYQGLQTHAVEVVVRHADRNDAADLFKRLSTKAADCDSAKKTRRGTSTRRHDPKLADVDDARWWQLDVPSGSAGQDESARGVLAVARIDDRVVVLVFTSPTTDPSTTVQLEALLTQAARRLV